MNHIAIGIIEDDSVLLDNYARYFSMHKDYLLSIKFEQIPHLLQYIQENEVLEPEVILLDIHLPQINGIAGIKLIHSIYPNTKIIMLTGYEDEANIVNAIKEGATGYLIKTMSLFAIEEKIKGIQQFEAPLAPIVAQTLLNYVKEKSNSNTVIGAEELTKREIEIVFAIKDGLSYKNIGERLGISAHTVNQHLKKIYVKLEVNSKVALMAKLLKQQ